jgi:hypothetical protein
MPLTQACPVACCAQTMYFMSGEISIPWQCVLESPMTTSFGVNCASKVTGK